MGGDAGADVNRHQGVRDRVVEIARDPQPLIGDPAEVLLLALLRDAKVPLAPRVAELAP